MGRSNDTVLDSQWNKYLVVAALLAGAISGFNTISIDTSDRFKGADFQREIAKRDSRIRELELEIQRHLQYSAKYTEIIEQLRRDLQEHETACKEEKKRSW